MSRKIVAFGASNSRHSINRKLAAYAAQRVDGAEVDLLDLNDYELPIYSIDREKESGIPQLVHDFKQKISAADALVMSLAEHNGAYTAAFKNILDWVSRLEGKTWAGRHLLLLATSPGKRGGRSVLALASRSFPFFGAPNIASISLPGFYQNIYDTEGITDASLRQAFEQALQTFVQQLEGRG